MTLLENSSSDAFNLHPLRVPELFDTICRFLDIKACGNLLFVSRHTYTAVLPIVWRDVEMKDLFNLIPGTNTRDILSTDRPIGYAIYFPAARDLTRFAIHAPFVKTLRTSCLYTVDFPSEWPSSGPDAVLSPLLPNLQDLVITASRMVGAARSVNWIPRLLYPGLLGLQMFSIKHSDDGVECYSWIDQDSYFELVNQVSHICPRIETLRLFPKDIAQSGEDNCLEIYNQITSLQHLRSLTFSGTMVHEELLKVLGQLPHLETLSLCTDNMEEWEYDESPLAVSNDSFPSLRHLYLYGLDESAMSRVCKVPPLFHHLVKVIIVFEDQYFDENMEDNGRSDVAVTCLGQNSPHVEELTILPRGDNGLFFISRPTLDKLKRMPLRYLRLGDFIFSGGYEESDDEGDEGANNPSDCFESHRRGESHWKSLLSSVPQLEELHLERKPLDPQLLQLIALGLPNLRLLVFGDLDLKKVKSSGKANPVAARPITLRGYSYFWCQKLFNRNLPSEEHIYNAAKYILSIWPNITACETHKTTGDTGITDSEPDETAVPKLCAAIQSLKAGANYKRR